MFVQAYKVEIKAVVTEEGLGYSVGDVFAKKTYYAVDPKYFSTKFFGKPGVETEGRVLAGIVGQENVHISIAEDSVLCAYVHAVKPDGNVRVLQDFFDDYRKRKMNRKNAALWPVDLVIEREKTDDWAIYVVGFDVLDKDNLRKFIELSEDPDNAGSICPKCGEFFIPTSSRQKYCSEKCSSAARSERLRERRKEQGLCTRCGKPADREGSYCSDCIATINGTEAKS